MPAETADRSVSSSTGLVRKSTAPAFIAFGRTSARRHGRLGKRSVRCGPPALSGDRIRRARASARRARGKPAPDAPCVRDSPPAEAKVSTRNRADRNTRSRQHRTASSSSTTHTKASGLAGWPWRWMAWSSEIISRWISQKTIFTAGDGSSSLSRDAGRGLIGTGSYPGLWELWNS